MSPTFHNTTDRFSILTRLLVTVVCFAAYEVVKILIYACVAFQYAYLLIAGKSSEPVKIFCNRLSMYAYRILRFTTLNDNERPFPFSSLPTENECEKSVDTIRFP